MAEKLKEYCTVISGYAFKSKDLSEGTDIPVIKIGNISNGKNVVIDDSTQYVNEEFLSVDEKYHIKNGDILISCKIYKIKYVPVKSSPISGMMRYFGADSETKGTDE